MKYPGYTHQALPKIKMNLRQFILSQGCTRCGHTVKSQLSKESRTGFSMAPIASYLLILWTDAKIIIGNI